MANNDAMEKAQLLDFMQAGYDRLARILANVTDAQMMRPGVVGDWSIKDILAHLMFWEKRQLDVLEHMTRGEKPPLLSLPEDADWDATMNRLNAANTRQHADRSLADVRADFEDTYQKLVAYVGTLTDVQLQARLFGEDDVPLWHHIAANSCAHFDEHRMVIEVWLADQTELGAAWPGIS